jgi:hypothetical protein
MSKIYYLLLNFLLKYSQILSHSSPFIQPPSDELNTDIENRPLENVENWSDHRHLGTYEETVVYNANCQDSSITGCNATSYVMLVLMLVD